MKAYGYKQQIIDNLKKIDNDSNNFYNHKGLNFLSKLKINNKNLVILFHGAVPGNNTNRIIFRGFNYEIENTDIICVCDYLLNIYDKYRVNWSLSTTKYNINMIYIDVFNHLINSKIYNNVIFTGTSAGGYPALKFASYFNKIALISNSQIYLEKYGSSAISSGFYHLKNIVEEPHDLLLYENKDIEKHIKQKQPHKIILYNNIFDSTYKAHVIPFIEFLKNNSYDNILNLITFAGTPEENQSQHSIQFPENKTHFDILKELILSLL